MGSYAYKYVRDRVPPFIENAIDEYEGTCDYDGDLWIAAANYIDRLETALSRQPASAIGDAELVEWLTTRSSEGYGNPPIQFAEEKD